MTITPNLQYPWIVIGYLLKGEKINLESVNDRVNEIVVTDLVKHYGEVEAVNGINFTVRKGELFGFLGLNDAGKTTIISVLCGLLHSTAGKVTFGGLDLKRDLQKIKSSIGVCP